MERETFTINNTSFASSIMLSAQEQADVAALPSPKRLSTFLREVTIRRKADLEERGIGYAQAGISFFRPPCWFSVNFHRRVAHYDNYFM
jgi:hypothetical protein